MAKRDTRDTIYVWISRWEEFQHYAPERDRAPAWIKTYTRQLDDDRYLDLTPGQRALLHDLRAEFARARGELRASPERLSRRIGATVYRRQLETLNHAGFIEFISREVLEHRLEKLYASRARPRSRGEVEVEEEKELDLRTSSCDLDAADPDEEPGPDDEPLNTTTKNGSHSLDKIDFKSLVPNLDLEP